MNELLDNQGRLTRAKVEELRRLKQKRAKWREERAEEDREYLDRVQLLQHPLPTSQEGRYYKKSRELEVRQQVNIEQRQNALSQLQTSNETLTSLKKELSEKIQDIEEARIRLALGVPPKQESACADDTQVMDSIKGVEDTFETIQQRIKEIAKDNCIDLSVNIHQKHVSIDDKDIESKVTKPKEGSGSHWKRLNNLRKVAAKSNEKTSDLTEDEKIKDEKRVSPSQRASEVGDELKSVRRSYLQRGGRDADVLSRIADMENNASTLSQGDGRVSDAELRAVTDQLASIQRENAKITTQLLELKGKQDHTKSTDSRLASPHLVPKQREYERQWEELREDLTLLQEQVALQRAQRQFDHVTRNDRPHQDLSNRSIPVQKASDTRRRVDTLGSRLDPASVTRLDPLQQAPYDPKSGFVIFYDAVVGLEPAVEMCGLAASLYTEQREFGQPSHVPTVLCQGAPPDTDHSQNHKVAILGTRQSVPRCWPAHDMLLVMELQVGVSDVEPSPRDPISAVPSPSQVTQLTAKAWCKLDVFDTELSLRSGWWRLPLRVLPVRPAEQDILPQYGRAELLVRLVNQRDSAAQSNIPLNLSELLPMYRRPDVVILENVTPDIRTPSTRLPTVATDRKSRDYAMGSTSIIAPISELSIKSAAEKTDMCLQILNVKHAPLGEARIRVNVYNTDTGRVVQALEGPVTSTTAPVKSGFRHQLHVFGQHEAAFHDVPLTSRVVMVVKLYVKPMISQKDNSVSGQPTEERMVAWAAIPLLKTGHSATGMLTCRLVEGLHQLQFIPGTVPDLTRPDLLLASPGGISRRSWGIRLESGRPPVVAIRIFSTSRRPGSPTDSSLSSEDEEEINKTWLPVDRQSPATDLFKPGDGFDIYIDGCRFLPDGTTISKVAGRILDREYHKVGRDVSATLELDSDVYNPVYAKRIEVREQRIPATATLLLKIYTIDRWSGKLMVLGFATLKIFTLRGTTDQPQSNDEIDVALNAGAHQIRLWAVGPDGLEPLTEDCLKTAGVRHVPCGTLLVRLVKAPFGPDGNPLEAIKVPQSDWRRLGLWVPPPDYNQGQYISTLCEPSRAERQLYRDQQNRHALSAKDALSIVTQQTELVGLKTEKAMETFLKKRLTRDLDSSPGQLDLTYVARYSPKYGIKVSLDGATNLPWHGFTHATICLNPPGALYHGAPSVRFDRPMFTSVLDTQSHAKAPRWGDSYKLFTHRTYHPHLCAIINLHEVMVSSDDKGFNYTLMDQAWTAVPVVTGGYLSPEVSNGPEGYAVTSAIQAPLFAGQPSVSILSALTSTGISALWNKSVNYKKNKLQLVKSASVWIRVADGRRGEELPYIFDLKDQSTVDDRLLQDPDSYILRAETGPELNQLVPRERTTAAFYDNLASNFKALVYRRYNDTSVK